MHLTLLKADGHFAIWVDRQSVRAGEKLQDVLGRLSRDMEDAVRAGEPITASFEVTYGGREYFPPEPEDVANARAQLSCFKGALIDPVNAAEVPK